MTTVETCRHTATLITCQKGTILDRLWLAIEFLIFKGGIYLALKMAVLVNWPLRHIIHEVFAMPYRIMRFIFIGSAAHLMTRTKEDAVNDGGNF